MMARNNEDMTEVAEGGGGGSLGLLGAPGQISATQTLPNASEQQKESAVARLRPLQAV